MAKLFLRVLLVLLGIFAAPAVALLVHYGGGEPYPDLSSTPLFDEDALEVVVSSTEPIGNVAVSADDRVFYTIHPESRLSGPKLLEWVDGAPKPFPSTEARALFEIPL